MREQRMQALSEAVVIACLRTMSARLSEAAAIAKAALVCAEDGSTDRAMAIAFEVEESVRDATTLFKAATIMHREREGEGKDHAEE